MNTTVFTRLMKYGGLTSSCEIWGPGGLELAEAIAMKMDLPADSVVLDVGAGSGEISCFLAREFGWRVIAIEHWGGMDAVQKIRDKAASRGLRRRVTGMNGDACKLLLADGCADGVFCQGTFEMIGDRPKALAEMKRVVVAGGVIGIGEPIWKQEPSRELVQSLNESATGRDFLKCFRTVDWTTGLMRQTGLEVLSSEISAEGDRWWSDFYLPWRDETGRARLARQQDELDIWDRDRGQFQGIGIAVARKPQ